jgi:hypothetical protein
VKGNQQEAEPATACSSTMVIAEVQVMEPETADTVFVAVS